MTDAVRRPCGSWPTPITADLVVQASRSLSGVALDGEVVYWSELRPEEGGRTQIVRLEPGGEPADVLPADANARTRVHEYGGGAWWVRDGVIWYVEWADQRLRRIEPGAEPVTVTPEPPEGGSVRWADGDVHPGDGRIALVRETHPAGSRGAVDVVNEIVVLDSAGEQDVVVSGPDFVSDPRWSPDGASLAWLEWDHPAMPWDASTLKVQTGMGVVTVAGGVDQPDEGVCQPQWAPDGSLWFCSDRAGLVVPLPLDAPRPVSSRCCTGRARSERPSGTFGNDAVRVPRRRPGRARSAARGQGLGAPARERRNPGRPARRQHLRRGPGCRRRTRSVLIGSSPVEEPAVLRFASASRRVRPLGEVETLSVPRDLGIDPGWFSLPEHIEFPGGDGRPTYANFYRPTNPDALPLDGELPPVIVTIHGGPTSNAVTTLSLSQQFWTSRGFAVVDVDYGGSTGYGREYRNRLQRAVGAARRR